MKELVTTLLFLRNDDQILLAMKKRGHGAGHWNGVGGKVEGNETIEQAMVRECQEEIAVTPVAYQKVAVLDFYEHYQGAAGHIICNTFVATEWSGIPAETEEMSPQWFQISGIPYDSMWPDDAQWLPQVLAGAKLTGSFYYNATNELQTYTINTVEALS